MKNVQIRKIKIADAENFLSLCKQLDEETEFIDEYYMSKIM